MDIYHLQFNHSSYFNGTEDGGGIGISVPNSDEIDQTSFINDTTAAITSANSISAVVGTLITTMDDTLGTLAWSDEFDDPGYTLRYGLLGSIVLR